MPPVKEQPSSNGGIPWGTMLPEQMSDDPSVYGQTIGGIGSLYSAYKMMNPTT